nr:hypothetical protein [Tanacetum cinerariifolium]
GKCSWAKCKSDKVLQLQGIWSLCQELHSQAKEKEKGCCLSSNTAADCSEGRGRNPTSS